MDIIHFEDFLRSTSVFLGVFSIAPEGMNPPYIYIYIYMDGMYPVYYIYIYMVCIPYIYIIWYVVVCIPYIYIYIYTPYYIYMYIHTPLKNIYIYTIVHTEYPIIYPFSIAIFHVPSILASRRSSLVGMQRRDEALENVQKALEEQSEAMRRGGAMALDGNGSSTREIYTISTISTTGIGGMFFRISYTMDLVPCLWT